MKLVAKTNPAKFQQNQLIFSAASSPLKFCVADIEVSIALQLENWNVTLSGCDILARFSASNTEIIDSV